MPDYHLKYRPSDWDEVVGHEEVCVALQADIGNGGSPCYLLSGPSGVGKTTLARLIATSLGCADGSIREVDAATFSGVDAMRTITEGIAYGGLGSLERAIIVDEAHALSKQAWTALLKSTEEPPAGAHWIFCTTELSKVPKVIVTRANVFKLPLLTMSDLVGLLGWVSHKEDLAIGDDEVEDIARASDGSPRQALTNLGRVVDADAGTDISSILEGVVEVPGVPDFCKQLLAGGSWQKMVSTIKKMESVESESIRISVVRYMSVVAMNAKKDPIKALAILEAFGTPYNRTDGRGPLLLSVGSLLFAED